MNQPRLLSLGACALVALAALSGRAQDSRPAATPTPTPTPSPSATPAESPRARYERTLRETTVHFEFKRAPVEHILRALAKASDVPIALGSKAKKVLDKRRFKIKYVASRRGDQVLTDLCKAANLDYIVRDKGVLVDLRGRIRKLRKKLGLGGKAVQLTAKDVTKSLDSKTLSISARKRSLQAVLLFLRKETGIPFVRLSEGTNKGEPEPTVTLTLTSVSLRELLDKIFHPLGLDWLQQGRAILVGSKKAIAEQRQSSPKSKPAPKTTPQPSATPR